jgi:putative membrane protein
MSDGLFSDPAVELSARRTGMSFQRTRLSADRTLMSVIRTSLSLISFGFTINQVFQNLKEQSVLHGASAGRNFGQTLVVLGIGMLLIGIIYHWKFMAGLRTTRTDLRQQGLIHADSQFPPSFTLFTALVLLLFGVVVIVSMVVRAGPFG